MDINYIYIYIYNLFLALDTVVYKCQYSQFRAALILNPDSLPPKNGFFFCCGIKEAKQRKRGAETTKKKKNKRSRATQTISPAAPTIKYKMSQKYNFPSFCYHGIVIYSVFRFLFLLPSISPKKKKLKRI